MVGDGNSLNIFAQFPPLIWQDPNNLFPAHLANMALDTG